MSVNVEQCCSILGVLLQEANIPKVRKAFRKLAIKFHPDKNNSPSAVQKFRQVKQAHDSLVEYLSKAAPKREESKEQKNDTQSGDSNPKPKPSFPKDPSVEYKVTVSLEEILTGTEKKMKITRSVVSDDGLQKRGKECIVLHVKIKPGVEAGTRIVFPEEGNRAPNTIPGDIVFIVEQKSHAIFKRIDTVDLCVTVPINFISSISSTFNDHFVYEFDTLEGNSIIFRAEHDLLTTVTTEKRYFGHGLPYLEDNKIRGDIVLQFKLVYPPHLTVDKRRQIIKLMSLDL